MDNNETVTFEIAKIAKENGFNEECTHYGDNEGRIDTFEYYESNRTNTEDLNDIRGDSENKICTVPTYHQLIDWVFNVNEDGIPTTKQQLDRLELWYNLLKDCPLKNEFKGRLIEWFRSNDLYIQTYWNKSHKVTVSILNDCEITVHTDLFGEYFNSYKEAEHEGVLEMFKLMNNK